ncbi:hypothetical protein FOZ63_029408 [Perkinsus olseni]|uniref:Uncharacterized protein n=1 Tax=Perkinsus olseni TaxID=32597 RepID=A0A7J6QIP2_PEROL|nr:hypothetical protein FOZ63_029408 [Perkinsus olseni]
MWRSFFFQLQNEKEQLELDLRLIDDDARFIEEELTRLQTRAEKAQAEADAKFIRDELAKLKAGEEDVEDEEDVSGEDEEYEESSSEADEEEEEEESYEFEEDDGSSGLDDNSEVAVRKNREQFFEMMMELEQLKMEAQAADQLDKLADALKKDESKRLKAFEDNLKHREEQQNENDKAKENCESLILLTGILVKAELEVTNPRGHDIEDTGYCMVDAGSKGKAVFELEEVVQPVLIGRVPLGELPSPKVKKPASVDITVEAVIETRHAAADGDVGTAARPEPMGITGTSGDPPSPVGDGVLAEEVASQEEFEPERKRVSPWKPAVRLVHLKCGKNFKLAGPLAEDVDDEDAICEGLTRRARQIDRFNQALHVSIPRIGEVRRKGPGKSMFDVCTKAVHEVAAKLEKTGFGGESERNRVFFWDFAPAMVSSYGTLIGLMAGVLARAELEITNPRGKDIEDTGYCMVDAGSKGKAVFELLEVAEPVWEGRVALGKVPSPRVKKPASAKITVEAVIETRQAAEGHVTHVEPTGRPEAVDATDANRESTVAEGDEAIAGGGDSEESTSLRGQTGEEGRALLRKPAIRLVELSCDGKLKLGGSVPRDGGDDDDARCRLLKDRALQIERFNQALEEFVPRVGEVPVPMDVRRGRRPAEVPVDSLFETCSRAVREMASRMGLEGKSYKNRVFVKRLCAVNEKIPRPGNL